MGCIYRRNNVLWIKYYRNGRPVYESTHTGVREEARRILQLREGETAKGAPILPKAGSLRFEEAIDDVISDYRINGKRSISHVQRRVKLHLEPFFRGRRMSTLTSSDARRFVAVRQNSGASNAEINRELAVLKRAFSLAIQAGHLLTKPHIPHLQENNVRSGFFEAEHFEAVLTRLSPVLAGVVTMAYETGWRIREILSLEWRQVDFNSGIVRLDPGTTKNREGRAFVMTKRLELVLRERHLATETLRQAGRLTPSVFNRRGIAIRDFRRAWSRACREAGCPGRLVHDLRRTAVRNLVRAGVPERVAMAISGHKTRSVFDRYNIVSERDLTDAARLLESLRQNSSSRAARL